MKNPLLVSFSTPPFQSVENSHFLPAFQHALDIEALEFSGELLSNISSIFFNLNSAETDQELQAIAQKVSPLLAEFGNDITLNEALFKRVKSVYKQIDTLNLNREQHRLLEKHYKSFSRNGALLQESQKEELRNIDKQLSQKTLQFGQNLLADSNAYELLISNKNDLKGLPENAIEAAKILANSKNKEGYLITLDYPSYLPFMKYVENRELRKKLSLAFGAKGFQNNKNNNETLIKEIVALRFNRAQLLGYDTHAHFTLEERMAKSADNVLAFSNDLLGKAKPAAKKEFITLQKFAKETDGIETLQKWDSAYYSEKLKQKLFNIDDEALKPYFELKRVEKGVFTIAEKLFGLQFKENTEVDKYHPEVTVYDVYDKENNYISLFYTDYHPRVKTSALKYL